MYILTILLEIYIIDVYNERLRNRIYIFEDDRKQVNASHPFGTHANNYGAFRYLNGYFVDGFLHIKRFPHIYLINTR